MSGSGSSTSTTTPTSTPKSAEPKKEIIGTKIPDWVYENSLPQDAYYEVLGHQSNLILYTYQDCPRGRYLKSTINKAIAKANLKGTFVMKPLLSSRSSTCHKFAERFTEDQLYSVAKERQPGVKNLFVIRYPGNKYCIPYAKNRKFSEGDCNCTAEYFIKKCNKENFYCIVNPKKRRIVNDVPINEEALVKKLTELKENW